MKTQLTTGYWIATCQKMRYKGEYTPSYLLDPGTHVFHPLTPKIDQYLQVHGGYTPFREIEAMDDKAVKEEYERVKGMRDDIVMGEPREPRPKKATAKAVERDANRGADDDSDYDSYDSDDGEEDDGPTDYPTPPPPGFGDPRALSPAALNDLYVFFLQGDSPGVIPYSVFNSSLTAIGRKMAKELVAALGREMFARQPQHIKQGKALLHFG